MTEEEIAEMFRNHIKAAYDDGKLSKDSNEQLQFMMLDTLDELEAAYTQYIDMLSRPEYYALLERIVKGAEYMARTDITAEQRVKGMQLYNRLCAELEGMK